MEAIAHLLQRANGENLSGKSVTQIRHDQKRAATASRRGENAASVAWPLAHGNQENHLWGQTGTAIRLCQIRGAAWQVGYARAADGALDSGGQVWAVVEVVRQDAILHFEGQ